MISFLSAGRPLGGKIRYNEHEEHSCKLAKTKNDVSRTLNASLHNAHYRKLGRYIKDRNLGPRSLYFYYKLTKL